MLELLGPYEDEAEMVIQAPADEGDENYCGNGPWMDYAP